MKSGVTSRSCAKAEVISKLVHFYCVVSSSVLRTLSKTELLTVHCHLWLCRLIFNISYNKALG